MFSIALLFPMMLISLLFYVFYSSTYLVKQAEVIIIERLGRYYMTISSGLHFIVPFVDRPRSVVWSFVKESGGRYYRQLVTFHRIDLRESVYDFPKQNVITKDNVNIQINALAPGFCKTSYFEKFQERLLSRTINNISYGIHIWWNDIYHLITDPMLIIDLIVGSFSYD